MYLVHLDAWDLLADYFQLSRIICLILSENPLELSSMPSVSNAEYCGTECLTGDIEGGLVLAETDGNGLERSLVAPRMMSALAMMVL